MSYQVFKDHRIEIHCGHVLDVLKEIPPESVQCCVTSPPYWGLRDYGVEGQIGLEKTPDLYVEKMVSVFREVWRVLKSDGVLWVNLGDSYCSPGTKGDGLHARGVLRSVSNAVSEARKRVRPEIPARLKPKDLIGIPWRVAFALQADGWYLRQDIIWAKKNCMPESVTDRCTRSHEFIFMLTKSAKYFYNAEAIKEPCIYDVDGTGTAARKARQKQDQPTTLRNGIRSGGLKDAKKFSGKHSDKQRGHSRRHAGFNDCWDKMERSQQCSGMRNKRSVWSVAPANYPEAHFATYPPELITPCILAGSKTGDVVLDPFAGSGTTGEVALSLGRNAMLIELNPDYIDLIKRRTSQYGLVLENENPLDKPSAEQSKEQEFLFKEAV